MSNEIIADVFKPLYTDPHTKKILYSGRDSGKSYAIAQLAKNYLVWFPNSDVMYCRATSEAIGGSIYNEITQKLDSNGIIYKGIKSPYQITTAWGNQVHFKGLDGNVNRTKGTTPPRKYSLVIVDECEEIRSELHLENAIASFRRHIDTDISRKFDNIELSHQMIFAGNASETRSFWWNTWVDKYGKTDQFKRINTNWRDISALLTDDDIESIKLNYLVNPQLARFMYDNDITDLAGGAYPSFRREKHLITPQQARQMFQGDTIEAVIFGTDGAIKNDATCVSPIAVMRSGRACVLERFIYDPTRTGRPLAPIQYAEYISKYAEWMDSKYGFRDNGVSCWFVIDCAAADLVMQLAYTLNSYFDVKAFTNKSIINNTAVVNSVFARNMCYVIDYGGYYDWENWNAADKAPPLVPTDTDVLCAQLESVVWKNNKLDPAVPNDCSDSLVYGLQWYMNPENYEIELPEKEKKYG